MIWHLCTDLILLSFIVGLSLLLEAHFQLVGRMRLRDSIFELQTALLLENLAACAMPDVQLQITRSLYSCLV